MTPCVANQHGLSLVHAEAMLGLDLLAPGRSGLPVIPPRALWCVGRASPLELLTSAATVNQWRFEQRSMHAGVREEVEGVVVKLRKASRTVGAHGSGIPVSLTLVLMMMLPVCW